ncbi:MAG: protein DpdH, partial [Planctomycetaceae bacterium]
MNLLKFWPTEADCLECIKPEAENPSDAVFLAVHQEMRLLRQSFSSDTRPRELMTQRQFLNDFLRDDPSGRVIVPILGVSGIGKSHLVRWLDIQLRQREDKEERHVIRIPKSSSLKSVLGRILDGLDGPEYEEIRTQLQSARAQMDSISAKQRIRAELLTAIERNYLAAKERQARAKTTGAKIGSQDSLWIGHGDPRALPALLKDPATEALFLQGTPDRPGIISELARHVTQDTSESDSPRRQFENADLLIPDALAETVKEAGSIAGRYLEKMQRTTSAKLLNDAVGLLNDIVDEAIKPLATPDGTSLAELFYDVRRQLLVDGRELVLLVEDFAVLAGVQKALLDAIIREGETGGKREACMIRTALAVTDGYFGNLDTVKTRAVHGWWIENGENEDEETVCNQIGNFVAAYVNAARIGAARLETYYSMTANASKKAPNAMEFIEPEEDELALLASFGQSADHYCMFPFNQSAIQTIADWRLKDQQGRLRFHPRSIINEIVLPVMRDYRADFERGVFPPEMILGYPATRISADLTAEVSQKEGEQERRSQFLYLLQFWGNRPGRIAEVGVPAGVFQSFGLSPLDEHAKTVRPKTLKPTAATGAKRPIPGTVAPSEETDKPVAGQEPLAIRQFLEKVNNWRGGSILGQTDANRIRGWMNTHILYSINWEAELLRPIRPATDTYARRIYLPKAKGNPPDMDKAFVVVAEDAEFEDTGVADNVFFAIRAMLRYEHYNGWNYQESDKDYVALSNFVDEHLRSATEWIRLRYKNLDGNPIPALVQSLLWQARQLNVESAHRVDDANQLNAVFATTPERGERDDDHSWNDFLDNMSSKRTLLIEELLERVAAFQGSGKTPHAVDASPLIASLQELRKSWKVSEKFPQPTSSATNELKMVHEHISAL